MPRAQHAQNLTLDHDRWAGFEAYDGNIRQRFATPPCFAGSADPPGARTQLRDVAEAEWRGALETPAHAAGVG
ncbi:hypothetical protein [Mycobacterium sp.]|uniref:hypothetical protein n=1 Tax=Mycobacterium sp. TaxID=1785 RepID=UPI003F992589